MTNEENSQEPDPATFDIPLEIVSIGSQPAIISPSEEQIHDFLVKI